MLLRHAIGSVLRRLRQEQGTTLRQLSESSQISVPYLSEVERGRKEASSEILGTLCRVLDITERELLARVADEYAAHSAGRTVAGLHLVETPERRIDAPRRSVEVGPVEPAHRSALDSQLLAA
ncbi:helix-turn-helix domain-containing protein [Leifsonia sp. NPDC058248]|uniref:helix-turn-helix domain-containing protein n=1 Tax=Leifsonia sp. NPDC058248 TaxID=3346402 RepID=UPI0036DBD69E